MITIFTDGSSRGNPGPGGWGSVVVDDVKVRELGGREANTTNNRMELSAAMNALRATRENDLITIYTDSSYVINGITKWIHGWKKNGWMTKAKEEVLNKDLWVNLLELNDKRDVKWNYVGGHVGIIGNERCDVIATSFADESEISLYDGPLSQYSIKNILDVSHDVSQMKAKKSDSSRSRAKAYSYVSVVQGVIKKHATWAECERRVKGTKGARFKKSISPDDENEIVKEFS